MSELAMQANAFKMPWTTGDNKELENSIVGLAIQADHFNRRWAQKHFENFQFILGNHNLKWSKKFDFAIDTDFLSQGGQNDQSSQTNISRTVAESLSAMIYSQLPELEFESRYDSSSNGTRLSKTLEQIGKAYNERLSLHEEFDSGSFIFVTYAKCFSCVTYNRTAGGVFKRPKQMIVEVPKMTTRPEIDPATGETITVPVPRFGSDGTLEVTETFQDVINPETGEVEWETVQNGDVVVEMLTPYEVRYDPMARTFAKAKWIQRIRVMDYDDFMIEYSSEEGVIAENLDKIKGGVINAPVRQMAIRHFLRTMFSTPPTLDFSGQMNLSSLVMMRNKVLVIEHYDRPTEGHKKNPTPYLKNGRRAVLANGKLVLVSTPQYRTNKSTGWHPISEAKWLPLAPSNESTGPMSDTVQKNRELNMTDSLVSLALKRQAGSTLLINENSGLDKNKMTGEPGMTQYVSGDPSAAAAYVADKQPMPNLVHQYRQQVKDDVYEVSGAQESIRGERSTGATSGYQARLYEEREKKRTSKAMHNWEFMVQSTYEKIFSCLQQNAVKLDDSVVARIMRTAEGELNQSDVLKFLNGPIDYGVDVKIRAHSMTTRSKASQMASVAEAMAVPGMAERITADESVLDAYLDFMEIDILRSRASAHRERAKRENAVFSDMTSIKNPEDVKSFGPDMPEVIWQDDDMVHIKEHTVDYVKNYDKFKHNRILMHIHAVHMAKHEQNYKAKIDQQSPYVAAQAQMMTENAEKVGEQPRNWMQDLQMFKARKEMEAEQAVKMQTAARNDMGAQEQGPQGGE